MTAQLTDLDRAWWESVYARAAKDVEAAAKHARMRATPTGLWTPISQDTDPASKARRLAAVERAVALRLEPCDRCGKGSPIDGPDYCRCSQARDWEAYCWAKAALARPARDFDPLERAGWR